MSENIAKDKSKKTAKVLGLLGVGMFAFGFALVPLYNLVCSVAGINGIATAAVQAEESTDKVDLTRFVTVEFDSTLNENLPWTIKRAGKVKIHPGETQRVSYVATNNSNKAIKAQAIPGITPWQATEYFKKIQCFCFDTQTLAPGETREMALEFYVDRKLPEKYKTITLSYTFMNTDRSKI